MKRKLVEKGDEGMVEQRTHQNKNTSATATLVRRFIYYFLAVVLSAVGAYVLIVKLAMPTFSHYERLESVIERFAYTSEVLLAFVFLSIFLLAVQLERRKMSMIYLYLFYEVYLLLLFVVLFAKAQSYHSFSLDPLDSVFGTGYQWRESLLNIIYFIPLGALFSFKTRTLEFTAISLLTIVGIETIQYVFYVGTFALSDIILNFIGCVVGHFLWLLLQKRMRAAA